MVEEIAIQTIDLTKIYHLGDSDIFALNRVNLEVYKGQLLTIMGVSGSGKSTLLHLIGGIDTPTAGTIRSCGHLINELNDSEMSKYRKDKVGFVFQFENLSPILTAQENIELPMRILGIPREERKKKSTELLSWLNMENRANHPPHALSGGERQRIAVLVALANDPELILADEPTGELDSENSKLLAQIFKNMSKDFGKTILIVTHNPEVAQVGDKILEMRDGGKRYAGLGVRKAVKNVNEIIASKLKGMDVREQMAIDNTMIELDGTDNKSKFGGNAIVGISLAVAKAAANELCLPLYRYVGGPRAHILPVPLLNYINGGKLAATDLDFQEHIILPVGAKTFSDAMTMGTEVYFHLGQILAKKYGKYVLNTADEGGYTPPMTDPRDALDAELQAIEELGYEDHFILGLDVAANSLYNRKKRTYRLMAKDLSREAFIDYIEDLVTQYKIASIEDPLQEDDFEGFAELTRSLNTQIVGDDLFVTNIHRLQKGIKMNAANALLWKVNQIGTLTEALDTAYCAFRHGYGVQVSERSGQTEDTWLADLAVALNSGQIKTGAPCRSERTAQYNQLLRIEEELGTIAKYAGRNFTNPFIT